MEALYAKLYNKYVKLKKEKESQFDKLNHDQEVKFLNYAAAADEMIQYLKSENDRLQGQVDVLKSELASIRSSSDEQHLQYQNLLAEESQKNQELSEAIARLRKHEHNECSHCTVPNGREENPHEDAPAEETAGKSDMKLVKKRKSAPIAQGTAPPHIDVEPDCAADQLVFGEKGNDAPSNIQQPICCQGKIYSSGIDAIDTTSVNCVFQYLVEFVVGMKFSPLTQSNELCILANHQSSGYSFSLTWITNSRGETEVLYRVLSLGTFERVAPEWMKETLMFSTSMCSVFFERVSRVIKS